MGQFIERFLGLYHKPRDASGNGTPVDEGTRVVMLWRNRTTQSTGVSVWATTIDSRDGHAVIRRVIGPVNSSGTAFGAETTQQSSQGIFSASEILTDVQVTSDSITNPVQLWVGLFLSNQSTNSFGFLTGGYVYGNNIPGWTNGHPTGIQSPPLADAGPQGALFTFQGSALNDGANAGDQTIAVTPATGGRFEVIQARVVNADGSNRTVHIFTDDTTNVLSDYWFNTLNAAAIANVPSTQAGTAAGSLLNAAAPVSVAGANRFVMTNAAVAVSQDTVFAFTLRVWGGAPTVTFTGPSGSALTTNTSRFETG